MSTQQRRLNKLSKHVPNPENEPLFCYWLGHPWTEEERTEALREFPLRKLHWKSLSNTTSLEDKHLK